MNNRPWARPFFPPRHESVVKILVALVSEGASHQGYAQLRNSRLVSEWETPRFAAPTEGGSLACKP